MSESMTSYQGSRQNEMTPVDMEVVAWLRDELKEQKQTVEKLSEDVTVQSKKLEKLESVLTVDHNTSQQIRKAGNITAVKSLGGKKSQAYKKLSKKVFSRMWNDYQNFMGITSYKDTKAKDLELGMKFLSRWRPPTGLELEIESVNNQIAMEV